MKSWIFAICLLLSVPCSAQSWIPQEVHEAIIRPDGTNSEGLVWNKWDTDNFIILSLDKSEGLRLKSEIENIRLGVLSRWGVKEIALKTKTKLVCVPDSKMLERLFKIEKPHAEVRQDGSSAIWICYPNRDDLSKLVSIVSLANAPFFLQRGLLQLEKTPDEIRRDFVDLKDFSTADVFSTTKDKWSKMTDQDKSLFDKKSELICLLIRKEFGRQIFSKIFVGGENEASVVSTCGFSDVEKFNNTASRYLKNLTEDIKINKTPDSYLLIR